MLDGSVYWAQKPTTTWDGYSQEEMDSYRVPTTMWQRTISNQTIPIGDIKEGYNDPTELSKTLNP